LTSPGFTFTDSSRTVDFPSTLDVGDYTICINGEIGTTPTTFTTSFTHTVVYVPVNEAPEYTSNLDSYESFVGESLIVYLPSFTDADETDSHTETGYQVKNGVQESLPSWVTFSASARTFDFQPNIRRPN